MINGTQKQRNLQTHLQETVTPTLAGDEIAHVLEAVEQPATKNLQSTASEEKVAQEELDEQAKAGVDDLFIKNDKYRSLAESPQGTGFLEKTSHASTGTLINEQQPIRQPKSYSHIEMSRSYGKLKGAMEEQSSYQHRWVFKGSMTRKSTMTRKTHDKKKSRETMKDLAMAVLPIRKPSDVHPSIHRNLEKPGKPA